MKNLKCFEDFMSYYTKPINKSFGLTKSDLDDIMNDWEDVLETNKEWNDLKKSILKLMKTDFSLDKNGKLLGMENFPDIIRLYRIVESEEKSKINTENLGRCWTTKIETLYDKNFQFNISLIGDEKDFYIIDAVFKKNDINPIQTIIVQLSNGDENEINIKEYSTPIEYKIYSYEEKNNS